MHPLKRIYLAGLFGFCCLSKAVCSTNLKESSQVLDLNFFFEFVKWVFNLLRDFTLLFFTQTIFPGFYFSLFNKVIN